MALTIGETTQQLHRALRDYIEATYHVSHPTLVDQRSALLDQIGVIHQRPYLESTPRYKPGKSSQNSTFRLRRSTSLRRSRRLRAISGC